MWRRRVVVGAIGGDGQKEAAEAFGRSVAGAGGNPEILELRYPVVLEDFHIRPGSGGRGRWSAGDGVSRTIRFREDMTCAILSGHRRVRPFGSRGGEPGELSRNVVRRLDGSLEDIKGCARTSLAAGEAITVVTPIGGGVGPVSRSAAKPAACGSSDATELIANVPATSAGGA